MWVWLGVARLKMSKLNILLNNFIINLLLIYYLLLMTHLITYHGSSGGTINPDERDDLSLRDPEKYNEILEQQKEAISRMFPGVVTENGPAINETCIYTVFVLVKYYYGQLNFS